MLLEQQNVLSTLSQKSMLRRSFIASLVGSASAVALGQEHLIGNSLTQRRGVSVGETALGEDLFSYVQRQSGSFDLQLYRQLLGAANDFKEGDESLGLAASDEASRANARTLLARTRLGAFNKQPIFEDALSQYIAQSVDPQLAAQLADWTFGKLKAHLLSANEDEIKEIMPGLSSDVIACVVKLMTNDELITVGAKVFNPLPGSQVGARGYLGARVQPNSPTDNPQDIQWQVFNAFSFAVGDTLLGTNPVSSEVESVTAIELALADVLQTFNLQDIMPHCVLAHADVQAEVESQHPGATALWFQSLAGVEDANETFDISVEKMVRHSAARTGKYGMYFETGQGADATNGHGKGFDMVIHEARKYGFARALKSEVAKAQQVAGNRPEPWVHVNDVAGFIGPEIFRTREQLVRCCLEDIVMGKLHGLTLGLDVCSTLHMEVDLERFGLVPRRDHARLSGLSDGAADEKRPDAQLPYYGLSRSRPTA